MQPHLTEIYGPDCLARQTRRIRGAGPDTVWTGRIAGPVDRRELVRLLRPRFPWFSVDNVADPGGDITSAVAR